MSRARQVWRYYRRKRLLLSQFDQAQHLKYKILYLAGTIDFDDEGVSTIESQKEIDKMRVATIEYVRRVRLLNVLNKSLRRERKNNGY